MLSGQLKEIYEVLLKRFGPQEWWPGDTPFEIIIGAILTQNTNWTNVEKAIANLKAAKVLSFERLHSLDIKKLAELIRPAGYFNIKAKRLKNFLDWLFTQPYFEPSSLNEKQCSIGKMTVKCHLRHIGQNRAGASSNNVSTEELRQQLLSIKGVGPETADSILLYALNRPVFVVDAYTARIMARHHLIDADADYHQIQEFFMSRLPSDVALFNEYHALLVRLGKDYCKPTPKCEICPLNHPALF